MRWCQVVSQARTPWRVPVAGAPSRAWRWAVGQGNPWGPEVPVISVSAIGPRALFPGCCDVPFVAWRPLGCGGGCPPAPCVGLGSAAGSLGCVSVACGPPDSGLAADPGREAADELDASPAAWWGSA